MTIVEALKELFKKMGGSTSNGTTTAEVIAEIAEVSEQAVIPTGKVSITSTAETNCANYATAQVSDANLTAENIKKDVSVLGITGSYEGGGSSDFSTAEITVTLPANSDAAINVPTIDGPPNMKFLWAATITSSGTKTTALYKGQVMCELVNYEDKTVTVSGDIESMGGSSYVITGDCAITIASA